MFWTESVTENRDLYCMLLDESGEDMWDEPVLVHDDEKPLDRTRICRSSDGNLLICCTRFEEWENHSLWMQKFDTNLNALWEESIVLPTTRDSMVYVSPVPDADGGAYVFWADEYDLTNYVNHYDSDGEPVWDPQTLELNWRITTQPLSDGEGGVIVPLLSPTGGIHNCSGLSRVLPDGTMPWGEDGFVRLGTVSPKKLLSYGDNEYATLCWNGVGEVDTIRVYRTDLAGEQVCDPLYIETNVENGNCFDMVGDADGNLYITWFTDCDDLEGYMVQKITPDNQLAWGEGTYHEAGDYMYQEVKLGIDQEGNLYQCINRLSTIRIELLKYNSDGSLTWEQEILDPDSYIDYMIYGATMNVSDDAVTLYWCDNHTDHHTLYLQTVTADGDIQWDEGGKLLRGGFDCTVDSYYYCVTGDRNEPVNHMFLSWLNEYGYALNFQSISLDGETGIEEDDMEIAAFPYYGSLPHSIEDIDGQCMVIWQNCDSDDRNIYVNQYDFQGNQLWNDHLIVQSCYDEWICYPYGSEIQSSLFYDDVLIGWCTVSSSFNSDHAFCMKIADGVTAWNEPVEVFGDESRFLCDIIGDYVIAGNYDAIYVQRLNSDGTICDGWDTQGVCIDEVNHTSIFDAIETPDGLGILYRRSYDSDHRLHFQIVHEDGSLQWDGSLLIDDMDWYSEGRIEMIDDDFYAFYSTSDSLRAACFNTEGEFLWETPLANAYRPEIATASTPDGILVAYDPDMYDTTGVFLQHVRVNGNAWNEPVIVCDESGGSHLQISQTPDSKYFISWLDNRNRAYLPYVQCFDYSTHEVDPVDVLAFSPSLSNYPNPFNPETTISYSIPQKGRVKIEVFNVRGQKVTTLVNESQEAGNHSVVWNGRDKSDKACSSGIYFYRLETGSHTKTRKMLLLQ